MEHEDNLEKIEGEDEGEGGWIDTHHYAESAGKETETETEVGQRARQIGSNDGKQAQTQVEADNDDDDDQAHDMEAFEREGMANDPLEATTTTTTKSSASPLATDNSLVYNMLQMRTYDINITYDKYYQTPRLWLTGYDEHHKPLSVEQMYEDISEDRAKTTVTMEQHSHLLGAGLMLSIHPYRHADVMKKLIRMVAESGKEFPVQIYIIVLSRILQVVIPTIEYDYTRDFKL